MKTEVLIEVLAWSSAINYLILTLWFLVFRFARTWMLGFQGRWFTLTETHFDLIHYSGMAGYKLLIFVFNLAPYLAFRIVA